MRIQSWLVTAIAAAAGGWMAVTGVAAQGPAPRTVQEGVFSEAQAARGETLARQSCGACHGRDFTGVSSPAPAIVGEAFVRRWRTEPLGTLVTKVQATMPANAAGTLTPQQAADIVAFLLKSSGFPSGRTELAGTDAMSSAIGWPASPAAPPAAGSIRAYPPVGNLAQLMRGVFFPNSNLIFAVQQKDPGAPAGPANVQAGASTVFDWGQGIYTGWQVVDNAAIAIADISPIMLNPQLRCENGKPAPVTDRDWIRFTEEMITVSKQLYRLSQSRNQEAVSDATGDLSDACAACHRAYRDVFVPGRPPDPTNPQNNANRCTPRR
jgi:S-disulfanyl-L-cysteine oxidoreductase SoxD